jgi:low temperature requirement protein LtrA
MNKRTRLPNGNISVTKLSGDELAERVSLWMIIVLGILAICWLVMPE